MNINIPKVFLVSISIKWSRGLTLLNESGVVTHLP